MTTIISKTDYKGFRKGYGSLMIKDKKTATEKLWQALGINSRSMFHMYLTGKIEPKVSQAAAIEFVFSSYGVNEIWD